MTKAIALAAMLLSPCGVFAQLIHLDGLERLSAKAAQTVNFNLDGQLLQLAGKFMEHDDDGDDADVKKLIAGLRSINVRSYEFKSTGEYLDADVDLVRAQLRDPSWKRVVQVRSKVDGDSDVYVKTNGNKVDGLVVISAEPKQFTVVSIEGNIDAEGLAKLGGNFGIPRLAKKKPEDKSEKAK